MLRVLTVAFMLAVAPTAALALSCPAVMAEIDAALPGAVLAADDMDRVRALRAQGEDLHNAGDHDGSIAALNEAKELLGL